MVNNGTSKANNQFWKHDITGSDCHNVIHQVSEADDEAVEAKPLVSLQSNQRLAECTRQLSPATEGKGNRSPFCFCCASLSSDIFLYRTCVFFFVAVAYTLCCPFWGMGMGWVGVGEGGLVAFSLWLKLATRVALPSLMLISNAVRMPLGIC